LNHARGPRESCAGRRR